MKSRLIPVLGGAMFFAIVAGLVASSRLTMMPDVRGLTVRSAKDQLLTRGLFVGHVDYDAAASGRMWTVAVQNPRPGVPLVKGTPVSLVVAGPEPVVVPEFTGLVRRDAITAVFAAGFTMGEISESYDESIPAGIVMAQTPAAGEIAPKGSKIALLVSKGRRPLPVPKVIGLSESKAKRRLQALGFVVKVSTRHDSAKKGTILSQRPRPGENLVPGSVIKLIVSKGPQMVRVPNIEGLYVGDAERELQRAGFVPKDIPVHGPIDPDCRGYGEAYRQNPRPGTLRPRGSIVTFRWWWEFG